jgi:uncharacterized protein (DUF885 family)
MTDLDERRRQLDEALSDEWEYRLREEPEFATEIGDYRYNDRWSDLSRDHVEEHRRELIGWLERFRAIDTAGFTEQETLNHKLMVRDLEEDLEEIRLKNYVMPVDQLEGIHLLVPLYMSLAPLDSLKDYEDYLARLRGVPLLFDQAIELMREGRAERLMPPRFLLDKTVQQCREIIMKAGAESVFARQTLRVPGAMARSEHRRLLGAIVRAIDEQVRPAYEKLAAFIATEYAPAGRSDAGIWSLPGGEERYRFAVRKFTTTDMDPESIHRLGLEEVARIEAEQTVIAKKSGFADLRAFRRWLRTERSFFAASRGQLLETYRYHIDRMKSELPKLFGRLPGIPLEVRPMQEYRENEAPGAEYWPGTPDGSRPGIVYVNTGDHEHRSLVGVESTAYHEALPGHHLQMALSETLSGLPSFRRHAAYCAYCEGWALYSERLGKEVGFYEDPYSDFGRLSSELLRAVRLVVDTGLHQRRWTREQVMEYFREHSSEDEPDIQAETDRYIVMPGQALSYKAGETVILALRDRAKERLGRRYDTRAFHDMVLGGGALPLDVLAERVEAWIAGKGQGSA